MAIQCSSRMGRRLGLGIAAVALALLGGCVVAPMDPYAVGAYPVGNYPASGEVYPATVDNNAYYAPYYYGYPAAYYSPYYYGGYPYYGYSAPYYYGPSLSLGWFGGGWSGGGRNWGYGRPSRPGWGGGARPGAGNRPGSSNGGRPGGSGGGRSSGGRR